MLVAECLNGIPRPLHGHVTYSNAESTGPFPSGTIATVSCNTGYTPTGSTTYTCREATWSPPMFAQCVIAGATTLFDAGLIRML